MPIVFALLVSTLTPDAGWIPPTVLSLHTDTTTPPLDAATSCAVAWWLTDRSGRTPPVVSQYPVHVWCARIL